LHPWGVALAQASGFPSGTIYPILARLEAAGWVQSFWEQEDPSTLERPRRRMYHLTGAGAHSARGALSAARQALGLASPATIGSATTIPAGPQG
jgi:PadR family transcriptional regulator, regulatory protein PadR